MNLNVAQALFEESVLEEALIEEQAMDSGFILSFKKIGGGREVLTHSKTKETKVFKRLNGAVIEAKKVGFREVNLSLN